LSQSRDALCRRDGREYPLGVRSPVTSWPRGLGASLLAALGTSLLLQAQCTPGGGQASGARFDGNRAWRDLERQVALGPRPVGTAELEKTRALIETERKAAGLPPVREAFTAATPKGEFHLGNVYADLSSRDPAAEMLILGSHFDTKIAPFRFVGAND